MQLNRVQDPRDFLDRATRKELERFARARGIQEIECGMPAPLMREILRRRGVVDITSHFPYLRGRTIGQLNGVNKEQYQGRAQSEPSAQEVSAIDDLMRQWKAQKGEQEQPPGIPLQDAPRDYSNLRMHELRTIAKANGLKFGRGTKAAEIRAKLEAISRGENIT